MCMDFGSCMNVKDCRLPDNIFSTVVCVGTLECNGNGQCAMNCDVQEIDFDDEIDAADDVEELMNVAVPINYVVATADVFIYCASETGCDLTNPEQYGLVEGFLTSASGQFGASYGDDG